MNDRYFVMLVAHNGDPVALLGEDEEVAVFATQEAADAAAERNPLAQSYGWEVYTWISGRGAER